MNWTKFLCAFFVAYCAPVVVPPAVAQQWQVPSNSVPRGRGVGVTGFGTSNVLIDSSDRITGVRTITSSDSVSGTTLGNYTYNQQTCATDQAVVDSLNFVICLNVPMASGGSSLIGGRIAIQGFFSLSSTTSASNTNRNYIGGNFIGTAAANDRGTNTGAGALGAVFGSSSFGYLQSTATNYLGVAGAEINMAIQTGATAKIKEGLAVVAHTSDAVSGASIDTYIGLGAQSGGIGFNQGITLTDLHGIAPLKTTGTVLGTVWSGSVPTVDLGIDFGDGSSTGLVFTTGAFRSKGFLVNGSGNVTLTSTSANLLVGGPAGATTPVIKVDASGSSQANGLQIKGQSSGSGVVLQAISSATDENLHLQGKAAGGVHVRNDSGGNIAIYQNNAGATASTNMWLIFNQSTGNTIGFGPDPASVDSSVPSQWFSRGTGAQTLADTSGGTVRTTTNASGTASTSKTTGTFVVTGGLGVSGATFTDTLNIITPPTDAAHTDSTLCWDTTSGSVLKGSGTIGICLGTSSARYKEGIVDMADGLSQIVALQPKNFRYLKGYGDEGAREQYGFVAEDVVSVLPKLVGLDNEGRPNSVDLLGMTPIMVNAIKALEARVRVLEAR